MMTSDFLYVESKEMRVATNIMKGCAFPPDYLFSSFSISIFLFLSFYLPSNTSVQKTPL